jgi:predicted nucleic acid-binding protein
VARPDRRLSLTDCVTIEAMHRERIGSIIGDDDHFAREGFAVP